MFAKDLCGALATTTVPPVLSSLSALAPPARVCLNRRVGPKTCAGAVCSPGWPPDGQSLLVGFILRPFRLGTREVPTSPRGGQGPNRAPGCWDGLLGELRTGRPRWLCMPACDDGRAPDWSCLICLRRELCLLPVRASCFRRTWHPCPQWGGGYPELQSSRCCLGTSCLGSGGIFQRYVSV